MRCETKPSMYIAVVNIYFHIVPNSSGKISCENKFKVSIKVSKIQVPIGQGQLPAPRILVWHGGDDLIDRLSSGSPEEAEVVNFAQADFQHQWLSGHVLIILRR